MSALGTGDADGNGIEDLLDAWAAGTVSWETLVAASCADGESAAAKAGRWPDKTAALADGPVTRGELRLLRRGGLLGDSAAAARRAAEAGGVVRTLHAIDRFGGVEVLAVDPVGLRALLVSPGDGWLGLDRDGTPALDRSRVLSGAALAQAGPWRLEGDWTASVAILDSGCDTAHDDLGDFSHDNADGPPPAVGDALDWNSAAGGWPLFQGYKVIGWHDVTDDFPLAAGPWDYQWHGTALAGVVAGSGVIDSRYRGLAPSGRLTIVKFYDFDGVWRQWQGDFLAACAWLLDHRAECRVRVALCATNWDVDLGVGAAMAELSAAGILPVVAMGNGGKAAPPGFPARLAEVLAVGAVDDEGRLTAYSGRGRGGLGKPDLLAPGGPSLIAAGGIQTTDNEPDDGYAEQRGTSLAAAHVAAGAFLVLEALRKEGYPDEGGRTGRLVAGLLRVTAAPVLLAERADGTGQSDLAPWSAVPDSARGWGALQVEAAVEGLLHPFCGGTSVIDSLGGAVDRRTLARRLALLPAREFLVEVTPTAGLDVAIEIHDARRLLDPGAGLPVWFVDAALAGGAERTICRAPGDGFLLLCVKRLAGSGRVTVALTERPLAPDPAWSATLSGPVSNWPVAGALGAGGVPSLIATGLADVDPQARLVHALDATGRERSGWPVSFFPASTLRGSLTAPLAWNLDGAGGDEIVVGSEYGKLYLLSGTGAYLTVDVAPANVGLTAPVGRVLGDGRREVDIVTATGQFVQVTSSGGISRTVPLGGVSPLPPAVGQLDGIAGEELAVAFGDGRIVAAGDAGLLPGWPVNVSATGLRAPVLADRDGDGRHEIALVHLDRAEQRQVVFRLLRGDGTVAPGDSATASAPGGGRWLALSDPAVAWDTVNLGPRIVLEGLFVLGTAPDSVRWRLALVALAADGTTEVEPLPGLDVRGLTPVGSLQSRWVFLPPPLVWDHRAGRRPEPQLLASVGWEEVVPGSPNLRGAFAGWLQGGESVAAPFTRLPLWTGGSLAVAPSGVGATLVPTQDGTGWTRVSYSGARLIAQPAGRPRVDAACWGGARGDSRNSAAYPLTEQAPTAVVEPTTRSRGTLAVAPNPAAGRLQVSWRGVASSRAARLEVFDLRGRLVRRLAGGALPETGALAWDGRSDTGRPVGAGAYLIVLTHPGGVLKGRVVVAR